MKISKRITYALFAILLGGIGVHKFYVKEHGWGIIYLLFCWTYIPVILGIIEGIIALSSTDKEFCEKYEIEDDALTDNANKDYLSELNSLNELKDKGIISKEEFTAKKRLLLFGDEIKKKIVKKFGYLKYF